MTVQQSNAYITSVYWGLLYLGILIDIISCYCEIKRVIKGFGPSGIPVIPLLIYWFVVLYNYEIIIYSRGVDFILFTLFHGLCYFGIPSVFSKIYKYFK